MMDLLRPPGELARAERDAARRRGPHRGWFTLSLMLLMAAVLFALMMVIDVMRGLRPVDGIGIPGTAAAFVAAYLSMWLANRNRRPGTS